MKKTPSANTFFKSVALASALFVASPSCSKDCLPKNTKEPNSASKKKQNSLLISAERKRTRSHIEELTNSDRANFPNPFLLKINGQKLPLENSEVRLKKDEKAHFELLNAPFVSGKFFFCPVTDMDCPLYDAVDDGYVTFYFTPDMQKPIQYRIGFCSSLESSCDEMVYRTIQISAENE